MGGMAWDDGQDDPFAGQMAQLPGRRPPSPRRDASGAPVGLLSVPKTVQKPSSPREDATEVPVGKVAVPKTGQKNALPRENATEVLVGRVAVPKTR